MREHGSTPTLVVGRQVLHLCWGILGWVGAGCGVAATLRRNLSIPWGHLSQSARQVRKCVSVGQTRVSVGQTR